jgi:hypothetical protein
MSEKSLKGSGAKGARFTLTVCSVLTVVWIVVGIYLGFHANPPARVSDCLGPIPCLQPSEWGDFASGLFAPVAFLWLVATVLIQSTELREQRVELALTRDEFTLSREVLKEQAKEARRQAEFIEAQTTMLADEANSRKRQEQLTSFTILVDRFVQHGREYNEKVGFRFQNDTVNLIAPVANLAVSEERYIEIQNDHLDVVLKFINSETETINPHLFRASFLYIYGAEELLESTPYHSRVAWQMSKMLSLLDKYSTIVDTVPDFADLVRHVEARRNRLGDPADYAN